MGLSIERFSAIVEAYGSDAARWPAAERMEALSLLAASAEAQALVAEARQLDAALGAQPVPDFTALVTRLEHQPLPAPARRKRQGAWLDQLLSWFLPAGETSAHWWRPAVLACVPLMLGLVIGTQLEATADGYAAGGLEEELYFISLSDYAEMP